MDSITVSFVKEKYSENIESLNLVNDDPIDIAIVDAKIALTNRIDLDVDKYGEERLQNWWRELTYFYLFHKNEKERMVRDKWDKILGEGGQIDQFLEKLEKDEADELEEEVKTNSAGYIITASEPILSETDILGWT